MTTNKLLAISLMIVLCTGFYSCDGDRLTISMGETDTDTDTDKEFANYGITDFKDVEMRSCSGVEEHYIWGQANFAGLRKNHLWIASFDRESKQKLAEWTDTKEFQKTRRVNLGYGEYKDITIYKLTLHQTYSKANSFVAVIESFGDSNFSEMLHLFKTPTKTRELKGLNSPVEEWYKESVYINKCCYTLDGDTIAVLTPAYSTANTLSSNLVSYTEAIIVYKTDYPNSIYIAKHDYEYGEKKWNVELTELSKEPKDAKIKITILDNSTNIWKYKADVTHYDGTKKDFTFSININDGKIQ